VGIEPPEGRGRCADRLLASAIAATLVVASPAVAQDKLEQVGRYQATVLLQGPPNTKVMILDTATGRIWTWFNGQTPTSNAVGFVLMYEGAAVPGNHPGDVIAQRGFGEPVFQFERRPSP
jgi:hypothetical protein